MRLEIYFQNSKLTTEISKNISVSDLLNDLKKYLNSPNSNFVLFDSNENQLIEKDIISIKSGEKTQKFYLIKSSIKKPEVKISQNLTDNLNIRQLISKCTDSKKPLETINTNQNQTQTRHLELLELMEGRNNQNDGGNSPFNRFLNILQLFEEGNIIIPERRINNNNNGPIEPDENSLKELKDMGFPEDRAREALIRTRNNITRATEILLGEMEE